jgi:adenine-specific DNA-methyltransferase
VTVEDWAADDTHVLRKARGAFFTPEPIARFIANWALRTASDTVLEPSAGDAALLVQAVARLRELGAERPVVEGIEIHEHSALVARRRIEEAGGLGKIIVSDFFEVTPEPRFTAATFNPPWSRFHDWSGDQRDRSRAAAAESGVELSGLASSWAAFVVRTASFLETGGRFGVVLPAELLSVNYAAPVRQFLFDSFRSVEIVLFEKQTFDEAEVDALVLLADGFGEGPTDHAIIRQVRDAEALADELPGVAWSPSNPSDKWMTSVTGIEGAELLDLHAIVGDLTPLETWGDTTLGMVTGGNKFFALTPDDVKQLGLHRTDIIRLSPPGSSHLRGLNLSPDQMTRLGRRKKQTWLFRPAGEPSAEAWAYIKQGEKDGVHKAYKCRVRSPWWRVPLVPRAQLLLTYMNADAPRIVTNEARAHHLNSVHGVFVKEDLIELAQELLPVAAVNSMTMLSGELVGRAYGGGLLKVEPSEADKWLMPSPTLVRGHVDELRAIKANVAQLLRAGKLADAVNVVDAILFADTVEASELEIIRTAHSAIQTRRMKRAQRG